MDDDLKVVPVAVREGAKPSKNKHGQEADDDEKIQTDALRLPPPHATKIAEVMSSFRIMSIGSKYQYAKSAKVSVKVSGLSVNAFMSFLMFL